MRKLAYEIRQRNEADYRYYRFQGENELLQRLDHSLKISDGALRFRIFKVDPETTTNAASRRPSAPPRSATAARIATTAASAALAATTSCRSFRPFSVPPGGEKQPSGRLKIAVRNRRKRS